MVYYRILISCYEDVALLVCDPFNSKHASEIDGFMNERPPPFDFFIVLVCSLITFLLQKLLIFHLPKL